MKIIFLVVFACLSLMAKDGFISSSELKSKLGKNLVILDTSDAVTYKKGHIPGAVRIDISKFRHPVGTYQLMNSSKKIQEVARSCGINSNSEVVIYGHNKGKELLKASYIALSLVANGFENISILNGGYPDWLSEYEFDDLIATDTTLPKIGDFIAKKNSNIIIDINYVKTNIGKLPMIEARPLKYFTGVAKSKGVKRLGHISKAQSSYWRDKFDENYKLKSDKDINKIFISSNKLNKNKELIAYCTGGLEASMNWYILRKHLGFKHVKIYDGSMRQWGNIDDTPMEK